MLTKLLEKMFPDSKITEFWQNSRNRALVLLPLWIIFIAVIFAVYIIPYNNKMKKYNEYEKDLINESNSVNNKAEFEDNKSIDDKWQDLFNMDYEYKILVYEGENITRYEGTKTGNEIRGIKSNTEGDSEYFIQDDIVYTVLGDVTSEYDTLLNINYDIYLNPKYIYRKIKDMPLSKTEKGYIYEKGDECVIISVGDYINSIEVDSKKAKYILNFIRID